MRKCGVAFAVSLSAAGCLTVVSAGAIAQSEGPASSQPLSQAANASENEADRLSQQAESSSTAGRYEAAKDLWTQALQIYQRVGDRAGEAATLNRLGVVSRLAGEYAEALSYHEQSLAVARQIDDSLEVATGLDNIGSVYLVQRENLDRAMVLFEEALALNRGLVNRTGEADNIDHIGTLYSIREDWQKAIAYYEQSLDISRAEGYLLGEARSLMNLGLAYSSQQDYARSLSYYQQSLPLKEALGEQSGVAQILAALGNTYGFLERYDEALDYYQQLLAVERRLGRTHNESAVLRDMGVIYTDLKEYEISLGYYQKSLALEQALENEERIADRLNNVAISYYYLKDYDRAIEYGNQSLAINRELADLVGQSMLLRNLGLSYQALEDDSAAIKAFEQSLALSQRLGNLADEAQVLRNLGGVYQRREDYAQAIDFYEQSLAIRQTLKDVEEEIDMLTLLGATYRWQGNYLEALARYQQSAALTGSAGEDDARRSIKDVLRQVEEKYDFEEDADLVVSIYERAISFYEAVMAEDEIGSSRDIDDYLKTLFELYWQQEDYEQAVAALNKLDTINNKRFAGYFTWLSQGEPLLRLDTEVSKYQIDALVTAFLSKLPDRKIAANSSLLSVLRTKGRTLDAVTISSQQYQQNTSTDISELLVELSEINTQLANLHFQGISQLSAEDYQAQKLLLTERAGSVRASLARSMNEETYAANAAAFELASTAEIQALIPAESALVEFIVYQPYELKGTYTKRPAPRYAAYVFTRSGDIRAVDLGEAATIDPQIAAYRQALKTRSPRLNEIARALDAQIMAPIRPLLGNKTHLLISPDSQLNVTPFDALVDEKGKYAIESYQISYLTSGRDLLKLQRDLPSQQPSVIIANPDYVNSAELSEDATALITANQRAPEPEALLFNSLPGTVTEAEKIAAFMPDSLLLTQRQATESRLKQLKSPSILHIATHGFFLSDVTFPLAQAANNRSGSGASLSVVFDESPTTATPTRVENPLLRSGLALAGVNVRSSGGDRIIEDGIFTALEASNLNLQGTQLVVLSACETGLGDASVGDGVYGLRRAFAIAGAESQLMSLWQVDDTGTSELMQLYYENLIVQKQGRSEALRNAQLEMKNTGTYAHPYYWSSFIFSGDWRPLE